MKKKTVFWGCGKIGKEVLSLWKNLCIMPDFLCDSSSTLWGKKISNIEILSPEELCRLKKEVVVFITTSQYSDIKSKLLDNGIPETEIVIADGVSAAEMIYRLSDILCQFLFKGSGIVCEKYECLIDLSEGMVLGGVERWSYSLAEILNILEIKSAYLMFEHSERNVIDDKISTLIIEDKKKIEIIDVIRYIVGSGAKKVICNFPYAIMVGACMVKRYINPKLKIISVLHNDEEIYFRTILTWEKYIDVCLTISKKVKKTLLEKGFPLCKIKDLYWKIPCDGKMDRQYAPKGLPIKIGYAGRISIDQKRVDLILEIGKKLREDNIAFQIELAGGGAYAEELGREIREKNLQNNIRYIGMVEHEHIMKFWKNQDICISCSEWEGHSISHSEAMAAGAVLVITDTSGARDDVENGVNGFIVDIGDVNKFVECIIYLDSHRECLREMGSRSIEKIIARNKYMDPEGYWRALLE
jgi:Glycosyltransferase